MNQRVRIGEVTTGPGDEAQHLVRLLDNCISVFSKSKLMAHNNSQIPNVFTFSDFIIN